MLTNGGSEMMSTANSVFSPKFEIFAQISDFRRNLRFSLKIEIFAQNVQKYFPAAAETSAAARPAAPGAAAALRPPDQVFFKAAGSSWVGRQPPTSQRPAPCTNFIIMADTLL